MIHDSHDNKDILHMMSSILTVVQLKTLPTKLTVLTVLTILLIIQTVQTTNSHNDATVLKYIIYLPVDGRQTQSQAGDQCGRWDWGASHPGPAGCVHHAGGDRHR